MGEIRLPDRTFGIEIEYAGSRNAVTRALQRGGLDTTDGFSDDYSRWVSKSDGSVYNGGEVASRILNWDSPSDRQEVSRAITLMRDAGCAPSEQAGIHIHVGVAGMTPNQLRNVAYGFVRHEDFLYRIASSGWDHMRQNAATYAHPYRRDDKALLIATDFSWDSVCEIAGRDRYYGVNFGHCYNRTSLQTLDSPLTQGTIEFRLFNTTMNPERVQAFLATAVGLVKSAELGRLGSPKLNRYNCYPLGSIEAGWRSERATQNAMMRALSGNNRVLLPTDRRKVSHFWRTAVPQSYNIFGAGYRLPGWYGESAIRGSAAVPLGLSTPHLDDQRMSRSADDDDEYYDEEDEQEQERWCYEHGRYYDYYGTCAGCDEDEEAQEHCMNHGGWDNRDTINCPHCEDEEAEAEAENIPAFGHRI